MAKCIFPSWRSRSKGQLISVHWTWPPLPVPDWLRRTDKLLRCHSAYPVDRVRDVQSFNRLQIMRIDETRMRQVRKASMLHTTLIPVSCGTPSMSNPP